MPEIVCDCPRCSARKATFDVMEGNWIGTQYNWKRVFELFAICRNCKRSTVFYGHQRESSGPNAIKSDDIMKATNGSLRQFVSIEGFVSLRDMAVAKPPAYLPDDINKAFTEGAACLSIACYNAAATMFRLCLDIATRRLLPDENVNGLNKSIRRSLGFRLGWLFDNAVLPEALRDLSTCIKDDGNDGAHEGILSSEDAEDILDFTVALLERLYTEPRKIEIAAERRAARRSG